MSGRVSPAALGWRVRVQLCHPGTLPQRRVGDGGVPHGSSELRNPGELSSVTIRGTSSPPKCRSPTPYLSPYLVLPHLLVTDGEPSFPDVGALSHLPHIVYPSNYWVTLSAVVGGLSLSRSGLPPPSPQMCAPLPLSDPAWSLSSSTALPSP